MRGHRTIWILLGALCFATSSFAQEAVATDQIETRIAQLSNTRYSVRELGARELIRIGEPALGTLQAALSSPDMEVRQRVEAIIKTINFRKRNSELIKAPTLRLNYVNKPLGDALADVSRQAKMAFDLDPKSNKNPKELITLDTGDVPYWQAIEKFLAVAGLVEKPTSNSVMAPGPISTSTQQIQLWSNAPRPEPPADPRIHLVEGKPVFAADTSSILRVKALSKGASGNTLTKGSNEIKLILDVTPVPSVSWEGLVNIDVHHAIDERGIQLAQSHLHNDDTTSEFVWNSGMPQQAVRVLGGPNGRVLVQGRMNIVGYYGASPPSGALNPRHVPVTLFTHESTSKTLKELKGIITARVLTQPQPLLTIDNLREAPVKEPLKANDLTVCILDRKKEMNGTVQMRILLQSAVVNEMLAFPLRRGGLARPFVQFEAGVNSIDDQPQLTIRNPKGELIPSATANLVEQSFNGTIQSSEYLVILPENKGKGSEDAKLVLVGRKSVFVEVPFSLKNVPLP